MIRWLLNKLRLRLRGKNTGHLIFYFDENGETVIDWKVNKDYANGFALLLLKLNSGEFELKLLERMPDCVTRNYQEMVKNMQISMMNMQQPDLESLDDEEGNPVVQPYNAFQKPTM